MTLTEYKSVNMVKIDWTDPMLRRAIQKLEERHSSDPFYKARLVAHLQNGVVELEDVLKEAR